MVLSNTMNCFLCKHKCKVLDTLGTENDILFFSPTSFIISAELFTIQTHSLYSNLMAKQTVIEISNKLDYWRLFACSANVMWHKSHGAKVIF